MANRGFLELDREITDLDQAFGRLGDLVREYNLFPDNISVKVDQQFDGTPHEYYAWEEAGAKPDHPLGRYKYAFEFDLNEQDISQLIECGKARDELLFQQLSENRALVMIGGRGPAISAPGHSDHRMPLFDLIKSTGPTGDLL